MSIALHQLPSYDQNGEQVRIIVDSPKGSRNKYKYHLETQTWRLSKVLLLGMSFPYDFGFIPSMRGEDGDPLDALVLSEEPGFVGCVLPTVLIGVLEAEQTENGETVRNDRLIAVIKTPHNPPFVQAIDELPTQQIREMEHFFVLYNEMEGREFTPLANRRPAAAENLLRRGAVN